MKEGNMCVEVVRIHFQTDPFDLGMAGGVEVALVTHNN
jgi:hypothetical protein